MRPEEIPAFVADVLATGCDIRAVGHGYVFGDADLPVETYEKVEPELSRIGERYGERDHLLQEIREYLVFIGRTFPPPVVH